MSGIANKVEQKVGETFFSGAPGTTGREPFEDGTRTVPTGSGAYTGAAGAGFGDNNTSGLTGQGHHHDHHHGHSHAVGAECNEGTTGLTGGVAGSGGRGFDENIERTEGRHHHDTTGSRTGAHIPGVNDGGSAENKAGLLSGGVAHGVGAHGAGGHHDDHIRHHGGETDRPTGQGYDNNNLTDSRDRTGDRTGNLGQGSAAYERSTNTGPVTGGAAGTDRFDSDRHHGSSHGSGITGSNLTHESTRQAEKHLGPESSGGGAGVFGTSSSEFTGQDRDRKGGILGAYADSEGAFKGNTTGPSGHSALTGREGNLDNNPVHQAKSNLGGHGTSGETAGFDDHTKHTTSSTGGTHTTPHGTGEEHKKGIVEKIKDML
ncbi:hypothetical protein CI109_101962 [Kwoniella shandongensis]|uniref:Uncharacterized protein n=1 Tax=Kwoniella shandongensis TaxID=1734106 RepID=A0A5M6BTT7_9TREE|nr:uncharacterized protein CI109_005378 [Kwoniella shandongensis]KAA5526254.1 hypothetical protein CI109_005378 [Kwoniella shandongensis]